MIRARTDRRHGALWLVAVLAIAFAVAPAVAQDPSAAPTESFQSGSVEELRSLAATLEDKAKREELLATIRGLIEARQAGEAAAAEPEEGSGVVATLSQTVKKAGSELAVLAEATVNLPDVGRWLGDQTTDPERRRIWLVLFAKLAAVVAAGWIAARLVRWALSRPRSRLEAQASETLTVRILMLLARTVLDVIPIGVFAAVAYLALTLATPRPPATAVVVAVILGYVAARIAIAVARAVLAPAAPTLRLLPIGDETANYLFVWAWRLVVVAVTGFVVAQAALLLGLPPAGHAGLLRLVGLLIAGLLVVFVLQNRKEVAVWIRGPGEAGMLRRRLADVWHVLAILYLVGSYLVWVLGIEGGFAYLARATLITAAVLVGAGLVTGAIRRLVERGFRISDELRARYPRLEARANRYLPVLQVILRVVVWLVAGLAVLQAWGVDVVGGLSSSLGERVVGAAISISIVLVGAILVWETASTAIERYLEPTEEDGQSVERSARARTLLPMLRNALLIVLAVITTLIVLSEVGVDIGPLLAGAGVIGLAIGFGSQKLVQDVITGAFILFEDAMAVGDVVNVAGIGGLVEGLSIRSIRMRDLSGNVHTIPFSAVDTVTNMTKEYSYYLLDIGVAYREDTDQVTQVVTELLDEMRAEEEWAVDILEPLEVLGVDKFDDSAVIVKARIKTLPIRQWAVGREFNRRMKKRFDELGIEIPFPHRTLYFGVDKAGGAPSAPVRIEGSAPATAEASPPAKSDTPKPAKVDLPDPGES